VNTGTLRRTHYQALAHRRYRRMAYSGGDGEWLVCIQCSDIWKYRLFEYRHDAEAWMAEIDAKGCAGLSNYCCKGARSHKVWRVLEA
jgi:hypothetical protein